MPTTASTSASRPSRTVTGGRDAAAVSGVLTRATLPDPAVAPSPSERLGRVAQPGRRAPFHGMEDTLM